MPLPLLIPIIALLAKAAVATAVVGAVGCVVCKVVDAFANDIATRRGYTKFFVELTKISWTVVKMVARTLNGITIDTSSAAYSDFPSDTQNRLDDGSITYKYSD